jgi:hypothetical protein
MQHQQLCTTTACCPAARFEHGLKLWLPNIAQPRPNLAAFQVTAAVPSSFDLVFVTQPEGDTAEQRLAALSGKHAAAGAADCAALMHTQAFEQAKKVTWLQQASSSQAEHGAVQHYKRRTHAAARPVVHAVSALHPVPYCASLPTNRRANVYPRAGAPLTRLASEREALFDERFAMTFPISSSPSSISTASLQEVSKAALSNLLGSMGYFVGASKVRSKHQLLHVLQCCGT